MTDTALYILAARRQAIKVARELGAAADIVEDVETIPVIVTNRHCTSALGCFQHIAVNGLGRITIYLKPHKMFVAPPGWREQELRNTVLHEFAHAIVHWLWPQHREKVHGARFQYVMKLMEGGEHGE